MRKGDLIDSFSDHQAKTITNNSKFAAVALILASSQNGLDLLVIKRSSHDHDPWSGQMALPGGHHEDFDNSLLQTACRETQEETNVMLYGDQFMTALHDQQGYAKGVKVNLSIRPFVFIVDVRPGIKINEELDDYYWLNLNHFKDPANHIMFNPMSDFGAMPGVDINGENILWGMTYRIVRDFFSAAKIETAFIYDQP